MEVTISVPYKKIVEFFSCYVDGFISVLEKLQSDDLFASFGFIVGPFGFVVSEHNTYLMFRLLISLLWA
jgi:hypothetical protein